MTGGARKIFPLQVTYKGLAENNPSQGKLFVHCLARIMSKKFNRQLFDSLPVVGIMRNFPASVLQPVVTAYADAGLTTLEITMNSPGATETIAGLRSDFGDRLNIGAGTVCTRKDLDKALDSGAQFIVTPIISKDVIKACVKKDVPVFAGAMTPTEIYKAWHWGATMVKVFPAGRLGPGYIKDVLEPLTGISLLPTGGVNGENFIEFMKAGAAGAGIGSALFPKDIIGEQRWDSLAALYATLVTRFHNYKKEA